MYYTTCMNTLVERHVEPLAHELIAHTPGLVIEGARQVGKSTLARRLASAETSVHLTLDDSQTRRAASEDMAGFVRQARDGMLVIDEVQRLPELTLAIKAAIDEDRRPGRFILTGSSSTLSLRGLSDSMVGRVIRLPLYGFSQGEIRGVADDFISRVAEIDLREIPRFKTDLSTDEYVRLIGIGAFPLVQDMPQRVRNPWLDSYLDGILRRDLTDLRRSVDPGRAEALMRLIAANQSGELVKARLAVEASIPAVTVTGYLDLLKDVGLVVTLPPWTPNLTKREVGRHKALVADSALALRLMRVKADRLGDIDQMNVLGALIEGFVVMEMQRQQTWSALEFELFHYRDRAGGEVDLVIELAGGDVIAVEAKASTSFSGHHFNGLRMLRDRLGDRFVAGIVLNTGTKGYRFADRLYGLPISALWEL